MNIAGNGAHCMMHLIFYAIIKSNFTLLEPLAVKSAYLSMLFILELACTPAVLIISKVNSMLR